MDYVTWYVVLVAASACSCSGENWKWPDTAKAPSLRIDTKVRFNDEEGTRLHEKSTKDSIQADDVPFAEPTETDGFYNRPPGAGRYPVRVQAHTGAAPYRVDGQAVYSAHNRLRNNDGTLDSLRYCKCLSTPDCEPRQDSVSACGAGKYLCCYNKPHGGGAAQTSDVFSEIEDERPMLLPGQETIARPFPPPPGTELNGLFGPGHGHETALLGTLDRRSEKAPAVLYGPDGPTGIIGPKHSKPVLIGPSGPTGIIGPLSKNKQLGLLVGPDGPRDVKASETAQRGVLVGPGGPTGLIGPAGYGRRQVLVGPGGPTGYIGPGRQRGQIYGQGGPGAFYGNNRQPGILVGPGGPTGQIGPFGYNHYGFPRYKRLPSSTEREPSTTDDETNTTTTTTEI